MSIQNISFSLTKVLVGGLVTFFVFLGLAQTALAAPIVILTVNGGANTSVLNGDPIELGWYIDGAVTNCFITEVTGTGSTVVVTVDTSVMPAVGTQMVVPPENSSTSYTLTCDAIVTGAVVNTNPPTVTMNIPQGTTLPLDAITGNVRADVYWTSQNANRCSVVYREVASNPGVLTPEGTTYEYFYAYATSGYVKYDGSPRAITETSTFYITCYNDNTGEFATSSITLTVTAALPPPPPSINLWSPYSPSVVRDELYGYAYLDVQFLSLNASKCYEKAYYDNGVQYTNPPGWGADPWVLSRNFTNIQLATTTRFEVTCTRDAITVDGITYPATSTSKQIRIEVLMPPTVTQVFQEWDRTYLPPVTTTLTPNGNPVSSDPVSGKALVTMTIDSAYGSFCYRTAYYSNGTPGDPSDDIIYGLDGWTGTSTGNGTQDISFVLSSSTRLENHCYREFDVDFGDTDEILNGSATGTVEVEVIPPVGPAPAPTVYLYGNAVKDTATMIWNSATAIIGFNSLTVGADTYIENTSVVASNNSISFPFAHPYGGNDIYDIHLKVCDENDGESTFRVYSANSGLLGQFTTNDPASPHQYCGTAYGTVVNHKVATGVNLVDGELITIECDTPADGEGCRLLDAMFGAGDGGVLVTAEVNPTTPTIDFPLMWLSERTTQCQLFNATEGVGSTYTWYSGSAVEGLLPVAISTSTTFSVTCSRTGDSLTDTSTTKANVPYDMTITTGATVGTGECIDPVSNLVVTAPIGYGPDPDTDICVPLVDLAAASPSVDISMAIEDNVNGTYDNVDAVIVIRNLGPGELPINSGVTYKANITFLPVYMLPSVDSLIGTFNAVIPAPVAPSLPTESSILTQTFNNIPFGTHTVCAMVNLDGSPNFPEASADPTNNTSCTSVTLPVPQPPMSISSDHQLIRSDQTATISWSVHTTYTLNCEVRGPGGVTDTFDASANYPSPPNSGGAYTNSSVTNPLTSTGEFMLQCTEPITGTVFTESAIVEVVPDMEET